jgi:hypothetical protein
MQNLFGKAIPPVEKLVATLLGDQFVSEDVTYGTYSGQAFDSDLGYAVDSFTYTSMRATRLKHNQRSVMASRTPAEVGDLLFVISHDDLPDGHSLKDRITDAAGNVFGVKGIDPLFNIACLITVAG